jgi:hypothetical protein
LPFECNLQRYIAAIASGAPADTVEAAIMIGQRKPAGAAHVLWSNWINAPAAAQGAPSGVWSGDVFRLAQGNGGALQVESS